MTTVTASIISTGEADKLPACLASLARQEFEGTLRVVVIVNGVADGSADVASRAYPNVTIIERDRKYGFGENHNLALASAVSDFGLVLNPDVILHERCVAELTATMQRHPRAAVVGPLLRYPSGAAQPSARRFPRVAGTLVRRTPLRRLLGRRLFETPHYLPPPTHDRPVDWMLGACLMVRGSAWRTLGGFDPEFRPLYVEDVDLAWRAWEAGWEVWQTPNAVAIHEHQAATDKVFFDRRTLWHARGMLRFVRKHPAAIFGRDRYASRQVTGNTASMEAR